MKSNHNQINRRYQRNRKNIISKLRNKDLDGIDFSIKHDDSQGEFQDLNIKSNSKFDSSRGNLQTNLVKLPQLIKAQNQIGDLQINLDSTQNVSRNESSNDIRNESSRALLNLKNLRYIHTKDYQELIQQTSPRSRMMTEREQNLKFLMPLSNRNRDGVNHNFIGNIPSNKDKIDSRVDISKNVQSIQRLPDQHLSLSPSRQQILAISKDFDQSNKILGQNSSTLFGSIDEESLIKLKLFKYISKKNQVVNLNNTVDLVKLDEQAIGRGHYKLSRISAYKNYINEQNSEERKRICCILKEKLKESIKKQSSKEEEKQEKEKIVQIREMVTNLKNQRNLSPKIMDQLDSMTYDLKSTAALTREEFNNTTDLTYKDSNNRNLQYKTFDSKVKIEELQKFFEVKISNKRHIEKLNKIYLNPYERLSSFKNSSKERLMIDTSRGDAQMFSQTILESNKEEIDDKKQQVFKVYKTLKKKEKEQKNSKEVILNNSMSRNTVLQNLNKESLNLSVNGKTPIIQSFYERYKIPIREINNPAKNLPLIKLEKPKHSINNSMDSQGYQNINMKPTLNQL
ncbi:UNKNOWN [Stylonychia lemnae]|uniref:Uncharacterized protein n=1 Tax=Stylonychia lemnae TaxID=5949 RepID=A0A078A6H7_STYLE|nr:UNKNOWN [Stylonychia lemnae]|eukprot:CDW77481.1 UNKNOWN [Stylonychia lemnae]